MKSSEKKWAIFCHLASFVGYIIPFGNILGPLVVWLMGKYNSQFVNHHGKESLNFQISVTIYGIIFLFLSVFFIGIPLLIVLVIFEFITVIIAAVKASSGNYFRYPLTIRFFKTTLVTE